MSFNVYKDGVFYGWHSERQHAFDQARALAPTCETAVTVEEIIRTYLPDGRISGKLDT